MRDCIPWHFMDWVNTVITGIIALVAAGIGALAVVWSTHRTLRTQVEESRRERIWAAQDEFDRALKRADKQVLTATNQLNMTAEPEHPYFTLDHGDLDDLLTYADLPAEIGFSIEQLSSALRRFNAAACWGNVPGVVGHERTVVPRWKDAQRVRGRPSTPSETGSSSGGPIGRKAQCRFDHRRPAGLIQRPSHLPRSIARRGCGESSGWKGFSKPMSRQGRRKGHLRSHGLELDPSEGMSR